MNLPSCMHNTYCPTVAYAFYMYVVVYARITNVYTIWYYLYSYAHIHYTVKNWGTHSPALKYIAPLGAAVVAMETLE